MTFFSMMVLAAAVCPPGQAVSPDTAGHCCWSSQVWSRLQNRCVGAPACPAGMQAEGESCVVACPPGQGVSPDTAGRCCWPNQVWASSRNVCVGVPACPAGMFASGEGCYAPPPGSTPPPGQYQQPAPQYQQPAPQYQQPAPQYQQPAPQYQQPGAPYQQPYGQPPAMTPPPAQPDQSTVLQARLVDLKAKQAATGYGGAILGVVLGPPITALGIWAMGSSKEVDVVWGTGLMICGVVLTIYGIIDFPVTAGKRGRLKREILETEEELRRLQPPVAVRLQLPPVMGLLMALSTPVIRF